LHHRAKSDGVLSIMSKIIQYVQVGQGRLGGLIAKAVEAQFSNIHFAKIDQAQGLLNQAGLPLTGTIERLVICISPGKQKNWSWLNILQGLESQLHAGDLIVHQLIFISSTRVYDGIDFGLITAKTKAVAKSPTGLELLKAEQMIKSFANNVHILRCSGLYSEYLPIYQKYFEILLAKSNKIRFGVNVEQVVDKVLEFVLPLNTVKQASSYHLLTDGHCYVNGKKIMLSEFKLKLTSMRVLEFSCSKI